MNIAKKLLILVCFTVYFRSEALGHDHQHGARQEQGLNSEHFHEHDEHEDHRHWYTKEANEKLKESLKNKENKENLESDNADEGPHSHHHEPPHHHQQQQPTKDGHGHSHHHGDAKAESAKPSTKPQSLRYIWFESILSTALISAAPFFILFFVPLENNSAEQRPLLKILLSFASGGLLGDAFLHLIPHAISPHSHNMDAHSHSHSHSHSHGHSHSHEGESPEASHDHSADMIVGLWVLAGLVTFLVVEKFVRHVKGGHSHSHSPSSPVKKDDDSKVVDSQNGDSDTNLRQRKKEKNGDIVDKTDHDSEETSEDGTIKVSGYLNLAADFTHNFTDGLAIGASYMVSRNVGLITTLTILLHEVPHEIGDFAILVQSGCSKRKAMWLQLTTATGALAGTLCGLLAENIGNAASSGILPFTAGGFIYIATVSVIPELLEDANIKQSFKEILALLVGVLLMVVIAMIE